jgi:hypothetical protein
MAIGIGDLVKNKESYKDEKIWPDAGLGLIISLEDVGGTPGAWVLWTGKGMYWSPERQLEVISEHATE